MKQIIGYSVLILCILFVLKLTLTLILNKLYYQADKNEKSISLIFIFIIELIAIMSGVINLTDKSYFLFYILMGLIIILTVSSSKMNLLFISKYLMVDQIIKVVFLIWSFITMKSDNIFNTYLSSIVFSPISNKETVNYSFVTIFILVVLIITSIHNYKIYIDYKNENLNKN